MIRRLRIKFVCINMLIVTLMLCAIFCTVLYFTKENLEEESIGMMQAIALDPLRLNQPGDRGSGVRLPYFALQVGPRGGGCGIFLGRGDLNGKGVFGGKGKGIP